MLVHIPRHPSLAHDPREAGHSARTPEGLVHSPPRSRRLHKLHLPPFLARHARPAQALRYSRSRTKNGMRSSNPGELTQRFSWG